jgi:hypothetical protein
MMANRLTMAEIDKILTLHTTGHNNREIADLLGFNRETVGKYLARYKAQNQPNAPSGSERVDGMVSKAPADPETPDGLVMPTPAMLFGASSPNAFVVSATRYIRRRNRISQNFTKTVAESSSSPYSGNKTE